MALHIFRKHQQTLWIILTVAVIVSFIWYFNGNQGGRGGGLSLGNTVAVINGQKIKDTDLQRDARRCRVALGMGLSDLARSLAGNVENENEGFMNFIWNSMVLRHEADRLQIVPSDSELEAALEKAPAFQTGGQFDGTKLTLFQTEQLPAMGFSDAIIDDILRDVVRLNRIKQLIDATVSVSPAELASTYTEQNQKMDLSVVRMNASDYAKNVKISDADAKKAYDERKDQFKSDEERTVKVAAFELSGSQAALSGTARIAALQPLSDKAGNFSQAMLAPNANFDELAKKAGATVSISGTFTAAQPDPVLAAKSSAIATSAFQLTEQYPTSDGLQGKDGYYVIHREQVIPSAPLTFEQAKPQIVEQLTQQQAAEVIRTTAGLQRSILAGALKSGQSFDDAAKAAKLTPETIPPFSLLEANKSDVPDIGPIVQAAVGLGGKELSQYVETSSGGLLVYMDRREPISPADMTMGEEEVKDQVVRQKQMAAFAEWIRLARQAAHLEMVGQQH